MEAWRCAAVVLVNVPWVTSTIFITALSIQTFLIWGRTGNLWRLHLGFLLCFPRFPFTLGGIFYPFPFTALRDRVVHAALLGRWPALLTFAVTAGCADGTRGRPPPRSPFLPWAHTLLFPSAPHRHRVFVLSGFHIVGWRGPISSTGSDNVNCPTDPRPTPARLMDGRSMGEGTNIRSGKAYLTKETWAPQRRRQRQGGMEPRRSPPSSLNLQNSRSDWRGSLSGAGPNIASGAPMDHDDRRIPCRPRTIRRERKAAGDAAATTEKPSFFFLSFFFPFFLSVVQ